MTKHDFYEMLYLYGWPWLFWITKHLFNKDMTKETKEDGSTIYYWEQWV